MSCTLRVRRNYLVSSVIEEYLYPNSFSVWSVCSRWNTRPRQKWRWAQGDGWAVRQGGF